MGDILKKIFNKGNEYLILTWAQNESYGMAGVPRNASGAMGVRFVFVRNIVFMPFGKCSVVVTRIVKSIRKDVYLT